MHRLPDDHLKIVMTWGHQESVGWSDRSSVPTLATHIRQIVSELPQIQFSSDVNKKEIKMGGGKRNIVICYLSNAGSLAWEINVSCHTCFEITQLSKRSLNIKTDMRSTSNVSKLLRLLTTAAEQSADACEPVCWFLSTAEYLAMLHSARWAACFSQDTVTDSCFSDRLRLLRFQTKVKERWTGCERKREKRLTSNMHSCMNLIFHQSPKSVQTIKSKQSIWMKPSMKHYICKHLTIMVKVNI